MKKIELVDAAKGGGEAIHKKEETHRITEVSIPTVESK